MPYINDITADGALNTGLHNFHTACAANADELGLTVGDVAEIAAAANNFTTKLNANEAAKLAAQAATNEKLTQKDASRAVVAKWAKNFRANPAISDALLATLNVAPHTPVRTTNPPNAATDLVAVSNGLGDIKLSWKRNGNIQGTQFIIEYRGAADEPWAVLSSTTASKFDTTWNPGSYVAYRVIAKRRGITSPACTPVVLWDGTSAQFLQIAA